MAADGPSLGFSFRNTAREAGLTAVTVFGGTETNKYLLETTGSGVAVLDFDGDGWLDVFLVNGSVLEGFPPWRRADQSSLSQQARRHVRRRDRQGRA